MKIVRNNLKDLFLLRTQVNWYWCWMDLPFTARCRED